MYSAVYHSFSTIQYAYNSGKKGVQHGKLDYSNQLFELLIAASSNGELSNEKNTFCAHVT